MQERRPMAQETHIPASMVVQDRTQREDYPDQLC